ncbi:MAG: GNAT family N-acetyltransferase [Clostridiales bacterium]|nr:GNAT family N-acetyltransferase [Clostridiales bacterium]
MGGFSIHIELKLLNGDEGLDIYDMLQDIAQVENGFKNTVHGKTFEEFTEWLAECKRLSLEKELIDGWKVPTTIYWLYIDDKPVGMGKIRHFLTRQLQEEGGHIGYSIRVDQRDKGYGKIILRELVIKASMMGIDHVLLTIRKNNIYSLKVAIANKGEIIRENENRYYIDIPCEENRNTDQSNLWRL